MKLPGAEIQYDMEYLDIGHEGTHSVWLWSYDDKLKCKRTVKGQHSFEKALASGRVDPETEVGSVVFSPTASTFMTKKILNELIVRFPGVRFFIFAHQHGQDVAIPLSQYFELYL